MGTALKSIIIHGSGGYPGRNWFPWLKGKLEAKGIETIVPQCPTPDGQSLQSWLKVFETEVGELSSSLILFGHSTGAAFVLNLLNRAEISVRATFLVAGFVGSLGHDVYDPLNESFFSEAFDWERIRRNAGELFIYAGSDDPYVPLAKGLELAANLKSELIVIPSGGHLNQDSGFTSFPRLLRDFERAEIV